MNFDKVINCIWVTIILIATVGYGDYYPRTLLGRLILTIAAFWGSFIISLLLIKISQNSRYNYHYLV
jgi:potassium intermediate/small conductance calcium-activated channel subfamily N protein 2